MTNITFHGAAGEVTGSCYEINHAGARIVVDCGMFQGSAEARDHNFADLPFRAADVHAVVLTHAHIDHTGLLPKLAADGSRGKIHATEGTRQLSNVMLPDSARIQETDAERRSKYRRRRGDPAVRPLYTESDAARALELFSSHGFDEWFRVVTGARARYWRAGHILGAASIELELSTEGGGVKRIVFSGDVGPTPDPLLPDPQAPEAADFLLLESTYGDRDHKSMDATLEELAQAMRAADESGGNLLVPVFAVGRAQMILWAISKLEREGRVKPRPVVLDSPMANDVTDLYRPAAEQSIRTRDLTFTRSVQDSIRLNEARGTTILAASGMCDAGRILHHLKHHVWKEETQLVIAGYQAHGSLGRQIVDGAREVRIMGDQIAVRARLHTLGGFSAHAGRSGLLAWYASMRSKPAQVALVHGEDRQRAALAAELTARHGARVLQPERGQTIELDG
jgi:metallo-beta-lactamase family protein